MPGGMKVSNKAVKANLEQNQRVQHTRMTPGQMEATASPANIGARSAAIEKMPKLMDKAPGVDEWRDRAEMVKLDRELSGGSSAFGPVLGSASLLNGQIDPGALKNLRKMQAAEKRADLQNFLERYAARDARFPAGEPYFERRRRAGW